MYIDIMSRSVKEKSPMWKPRIVFNVSNIYSKLKSWNIFYYNNIKSISLRLTELLSSIVTISCEMDSNPLNIPQIESDSIEASSESCNVILSASEVIFIKFSSYFIRLRSGW